jgi:hypothetical protein
MTNQCTNTVFDLLSQFAHGDAGFRECLHILTDLAVGLGSFTIIPDEVVVHLLHGSLVANLSSRGTLQIVVGIGVLNDLTGWERLAVVEVGKRLSRWHGLLTSGTP